ncbi:MAG: 30S ribosome-binding factor RbfA [Actinobacteria bacterium]|nr:30S ribosome-binding factor RbfA [Actinomycetota bacterium]
MSPGPYLRKVSEALHHVIAEEVERLKDPGLGFVTITGVDTSPDLRWARVYYSVLGDEAQHGETAAALRRASPRIRAVVGRQVRLKFLPELHFEPDAAVEQGLRMEEILRRLREERDEGLDTPGDPPGG